jgi:hypothetical protein
MSDSKPANQQPPDVEPTAVGNPARTGKGEEEQIGFIEKMINLITGTTALERYVSKQLKGIKKAVKQSGLKFYNVKKKMFTPQFGKFIYDIFRMSQHFERYLDLEKQQGFLKLFLIENQLSDQQKKIAEALDREAIVQHLAGAQSLNDEINILLQKLTTFIKEFTAKKKSAVNYSYNRFVELSNVILYNWLPICQTYNAAIQEKNTKFKPEFHMMEPSLINDYIIGLDDALNTIDLDRNIVEAEKFITRQAELDGVKLGGYFNKLMHMFRELKKHNYLTNVLKLSTLDPAYQPKLFPSEKDVVGSYLFNYQQSVKKTINEVAQKILQGKMETLMIELFGSRAVVALSGYNATLSDLAKQSCGAPLKYIDALNCLTAFFSRIVKADIKPRLDTLLVHGHWTSKQRSTEVSVLVDQFLDLHDKIAEFDEKCAVTGSYGVQMKKLEVSIKHNPEHDKDMRKVVDSMNREAKQYIAAGVNWIISTINKCKVLVADYDNDPHEMVKNLSSINWEDYGADYKSDMISTTKQLHTCGKLVKFAYQNAEKLA